MTTTIFKRKLVPVLLAACFGVAAAAPTGQQVVAGQATFSQQGNVFSITNTPGTIINWQSFSINQGEIARFIQQSSDSTVLNRIVGQDPSRILGALQSNGKVFLINPNGILFGRDSRVDVGGLVASTLNLSNADFLAGKKNFTAGATAGEVRNEGAIATPSGGQVFLVAPNVANAGIITSPKGDVVLAAGHSVQLVDSRDPDLQVVVSAPLDAAINLGQVVAQGGRIGIYGALVNQRGIVNANSAVVGENGKIVLKASRDTVLEQGSVTSATGAGKGGDVHLLGERVSLDGNAQVDASGQLGGGSVLVGGDWQGRNAALPNARETVLGKDAGIKADALAAGDGGKVVLWSDASTRAFGSISAQGGALGGKGGMIETSGHNLNVDGIRINAGAARGGAGSWLLDPYNIDVVASGTGTLAQAGDLAGGDASSTTTISSSLLNATSGTNISLQARNDITISDAINTSSGLTANAGNNINVNANVTSTGGNIMFNAANAFNLAAGATVKGNKDIDIIADQMTLAGGIGRATTGANLMVSLNAQTATRQIRVGTPLDSSALWLDPARLGAISAAQLNLGTSRNTGGVFIDAALNPTGSFGIDTAGKIEINAPVTLGSGKGFTAVLYGAEGTLLDVNAAISASSVYLQGDGLRLAASVTAPSVTLMPHTALTPITLGSLQEGKFSLDANMLSKVNASSLTIGGLTGGSGTLDVSGDLNLTAHPFGTLTLDAGAAELVINKVVTMPSGALVLKSGTRISEGSTGGLNVDQLAVQGGQVSLPYNNAVTGTLAGSATGGAFQLIATGPLTIGAAGGLSGISATGGNVEISTDQKLTVNSLVDAGSNQAVLEGNGIGGTGKIKAATVNLQSYAGIGAATAALNTEAGVLLARNDQSGSAPINISNTGNLSVGTVAQSGEVASLNTGAITISTTGNLVLPATSSSAAPAGAVNAGSGAITLTSGGSMNIGGTVKTASGNIGMTAGNGMTVGGQVTTGSGNIDLLADKGTAFTTQAGALVHSDSGTIKVVAGTASIASGTITGADGKVSVATGVGVKPQPQPEPPPPSLDQCVANPNSAACGGVIDNAKRSCSTNWNAGHCDDVMPKVDYCKTNPTALGCTAVIKRDEVLQCAANPRGANCGDVLPKFDECKTTPGALGCDAVVQQHGKVEACLSNPNPSCFKDVLPNFDTCAQKPDTFGCSAVVKRHDDISSCITNPKAPGCSAVLPPLDACHANAGEFGCQPVLAREKFEGCVANASAPGCDAVLPPLDTCKTTPGEEGCGSVIKKTFDFCLTSPGDARCVGVLPRISECVAEKSKAGCQVVLPKMDQCIVSPTLQGCSVILPKLELCAVNPNLQGCEAVLPKPDFCSTHPTDPTCQVFNPNAGNLGGNSEGKQVSQAVQTSVTLINGSNGKPAGTGGNGGGGTVGSGPVDTGTGTGSGSGNDNTSGKPAEKKSGPAASENSGAQNEKPATKTYCN